MINNLSIAGVEPKTSHEQVDGRGFTLLSYLGLKTSY